MKKVYREKMWVRISGFLFAFLLGCCCIVCNMLVKSKSKICEYELSIVGIILIFLSFAYLILSQKCAIIIDKESIIMYKDRLSYGGWKLFPLIVQIQIKWKDIIALYWAEIGSSQGNPIKSFVVIPKSNTGDKQQDEVINLEVKINKNGVAVKKYIKWLLRNDKAIWFNKTVKNYRDLICEICQRVPSIIIDEETRKLIKQ